MRAPDRTDAVALDGGAMDLHLWLPETGAGPGVLLLQEIFGVGAFLDAVARKLTALGYVVGAPDVFWRFAPAFDVDHDEAGLAEALAAVQKLDAERAVQDCTAALDRLRGLPEVTDGVAVLGYCLGGTLAWGVGAANTPDAVVSYYGSGVPGALEQLAEIRCPLLLHFGTKDPFIPRDQVQAVQAAVEAAGRPDVELALEPAGHAFENHLAPAFHHPEAAARSWARTVDFLIRTLPPPAS